MSRMSGRRKDNPLGLEPRVYAKHGAFYYVHRDGRWEKLGTDIAKANQLRAEQGKNNIASFGFRDLKGKGATDMWLAGIPIEHIQLLCGHENKTTTEIYVKQRWRETAEPNRVLLGGE
jgi:integrase